MSQQFPVCQGQINRPASSHRRSLLVLLCLGLSGIPACLWLQDQRIGRQSALCPFVTSGDFLQSRSPATPHQKRQLGE